MQKTIMRLNISVIDGINLNTIEYVDKVDTEIQTPKSIKKQKRTKRDL